VNPYDVAGVSETIFAALEMDPAERRNRMRRMRRQVMEYNIYLWAANALGDLREVRLEDSEVVRMQPAATAPPEMAERTA
jgi:trehalose 6-phosphate synthase